MPFKDDFCELTGFPPFPWQARLFAQMAAGDMPDACDIPTGLGKTSVMAIWLAALDLREEAQTRLPRRLIYVVDRRAVVDQATEEAQKLADKLGDGARTSPIVRHLRQRLRLDDGDELAVSTLRGQLADNRRWLEDPAAPAIVVGTVDMIGSRLLFSGYNTSRRMRPVHAALLGCDALIVLDEAHLVPPFQALVEQVRRFAGDDRERSSLPARPMHLLTLSATGRASGGYVFNLEQSDAEDAFVGQRLEAPKWLRIEPQVAAGDLANALAERAWARGEGGRRVIVFCNSRGTAEAVHKDLEGKIKQALAERGDKRRSGFTDTIELIVGSRRVREREPLAESGAFKRFSPKHTNETAAPAADMPAFLVATSAGEVGVDLDADHMVCDLVAWERMVQRLGRVNRLGKLTTGSLIDVFPSPSGSADKTAEVEIKADEIEILRAPFERGPWQTREDGRRNVSPGALKRLRGDADFAEAAQCATTPAPLRPALRRADVDAWAMTSLDTHTGRADVAPWLRGWEDDDKPQTQLLWRALLPVREEDDTEHTLRQLNDYFDVARPHLSEMLETETWRTADLMQKRAKAVLKRLAKAEDDERAATPGEADDDETSAQPPLTPNAIVAVTLGHDRAVERTWRLRELSETAKQYLERDIAGRTIVLSAALGGLSASGMPDPKADAPPSTIDEKHHPETIEEEPGGRSLWSLERLQEIGFRVQCVKPSDAERDATKKKDEKNWRIAYRRIVSARDDEAGEADALEWRVERWLGARAGDHGGGLAKADQTIADHHHDAAAKADDICRRLCLPDALRQVIFMAAANHDWGKARRNWQRFAGKPHWAGDPEKALAKFKKGGSPSVLKMGDETYRHEFGSLVDVIDAKTFDGLDDELRDLALHLIAAHHGHARPVIPPLDEKHMPEKNAPVARDAALRFARLQAHWGPWGLAWLEALMRAADAAASREHNEAAPDDAASESGASSQAEADDTPSEEAA